MDEEEKRVMDLLGEVHDTVFNKWGLDRDSNLEVEFCSALHVLQSFVIQRMLQRTLPDEFGRWYSKAPWPVKVPDR